MLGTELFGRVVDIVGEVAKSRLDLILHRLQHGHVPVNPVPNGERTILILNHRPLRLRQILLRLAQAAQALTGLAQNQIRRNQIHALQAVYLNRELQRGHGARNRTLVVALEQVLLSHWPGVLDKLELLLAKLIVALFSLLLRGQERQGTAQGY